MKAKKTSNNCKPFAGLDSLIKKKRIHLAPQGKPGRTQSEENAPTPAPHRGEPSDEELFQHAMSDVAPLDRKGCASLPPKKRAASAVPHPLEQDDTVQQLKALIETGNGFVIADTPEYIEGIGYRVPPEVVKRLHQGHYAIQDYIDLHGHSVSEAHASFQGFMKKAVATGKTGVLIIHGRGLSSPDEPVLKNRVYQWLTSGSWRKWVIAFSSARACDGGAGATYVLLRNTPMTKGRMKAKI